jgi:triphosphoribosyl-dephospho-CoA synthetase
MQLMMYIGNDLIEAIQLEDEKIPKPGYVGQFKRNLKMKYREMIRKYSSIQPEFLVANPLPRANQTDNKH